MCQQTVTEDRMESHSLSLLRSCQLQDGRWIDTANLPLHHLTLKHLVLAQSTVAIVRIIRHIPDQTKDKFLYRLSDIKILCFVYKDTLLCFLRYFALFIKVLCLQGYCALLINILCFVYEETLLFL